MLVRNRVDLWTTCILFIDHRVGEAIEVVHAQPERAVRALPGSRSAGLVRVRTRRGTLRLPRRSRARRSRRRHRPTRPQLLGESSRSRQSSSNPGERFIARDHPGAARTDFLAAAIGELHPGRLRGRLGLETRDQALQEAGPIFRRQAQRLRFKVFDGNGHVQPFAACAPKMPQGRTSC